MKFKDFNDFDLEAIFKGIHFKTKPYRHQLISMAFAMCQDDGRVVFWHDVGTGKSLAALYCAELWESKRTLIVCSDSAAIVWPDQVKQHTNSRCLHITGPTKYRLAMLNRPYDYYVTTYSGLKFIFASKDGGKFHMQIPGIELFDTIIFDECHSLMSPNSLQTEIAASISKFAKHVVMMTGTPIGKAFLKKVGGVIPDLHQLWAQFYVLDGGKTLGDSYYMFEVRHFEKIMTGLGFSKVKPTRVGMHRILTAVKPKVIRYAQTECFDLPPISYEVIAVDSTKKQLQARDRAVNAYVSKGKRSVADGNKLYRALQRAESLPDSGKYSALIDCVFGSSGKVVIFHQLVDEGRAIQEVLNNNGIKNVSLRGETKDKIRNHKLFINDPSIKAVVAHPLCGGEGRDLKIATTVIFFSNSHSGITRSQCIGRIHRHGQTNKCFVFDIVVQGFPDMEVLKAVSRNRDGLTKVLDWAENIK